MRQEALPHDTAKRIREALRTPAAAQVVLQKIDTCINFLTTTGGSGALGEGVGDILLQTYLVADLLMTEAELEPLGQVIRQQVRLKHLSDLRDLLEKLTGLDPMDAVCAIYKHRLEAASREALVALVPRWAHPGRRPRARARSSVVVSV